MASLWVPQTPWPSSPPTSLAFRISVKWAFEGSGEVCQPAWLWTGKDVTVTHQVVDLWYQGPFVGRWHYQVTAWGLRDLLWCSCQNQVAWAGVFFLIWSLSLTSLVCNMRIRICQYHPPIDRGEVWMRSCFLSPQVLACSKSHIRRILYSGLLCCWLGIFNIFFCSSICISLKHSNIS